ncbi:heavy metal translocating P-type ATPase [Campylobacter corcagiensis]|uniref:Cadmium-translocating P-type ATPase n=1 Tax=Campylobacter corcagiensis TaxID=1448857 RepID=A0A7M1LJH5_9BACT|nr:heavy metal translocating P-type ATPase [Campylobacter corcagiensis]QKF64129.1 cytochrome oxidase maturation protein, cbb3-type [Campylobacter corcagiensis]QOQ87675.1 cadmium-translocating P-type ATPase [Campylobacter corcagiensis]
MEKCSHCNLEFENLQSDANGNKFCCNGCKQVFYLLNSAGFSEFYDRRGDISLTPVGETKALKEAKTIYENYVQTTKDGFSEIHIIIDGIHCTACVWLNEKVLINKDGILDVNINASTNKASIIWDDSQIKLPEIFNTIMAIGYKAIPYDANRANERYNAKRREYYSRLLVGVFVTMNIMWIAVALYGGYFSGMSRDIKDILHFTEFLLATPVLFYTGASFFKGAKTSLKTKVPNMDLLIVVGTLTTYLYSVYAMLSRSGEVYFESVVMLITFVFAGRYAEFISKKRANDSLDRLSNFIISDVKVKNGENFESISANLVKKGDTVLINSGDKILVDAVVKSGQASFDYSSLTGESMPVFKQAGDEITSGAVCINGSIECVASTNFKSSFLNKIINLLENAPLKKPKLENLTTKISAIFSSVILVLGAISFTLWFLITGNFERSMVIAVSVLIVACPCALGLATPVATLVGLGVGLKKGIVFKEARFLEEINSCKNVVFDKTGTLTKGNLKVKKSEISPKCDLNLLVNLLKKSNHPVSVAVLKSLNFKANDISFDEFNEILGKGVSAKFQGKNIKAGSAKFVGKPNNQSETTSYHFSFDGEILASFYLEDEIKDEANSVIKELKKLGFNIYLLSGDSENVVKKVAINLGIKNFRSNFSPLQKAEFIEDLKGVIMVGDGINDASALSLANVGIAMGSGANISIEKSDVVLLKDDLQSLKESILISKKSMRVVKENLLISFFYNAITIPIAMAGLMLPMIAAISMSLSSIIVVLNSLKIRRKFK